MPPNQPQPTYTEPAKSQKLQLSNNSQVNLKAQLS